MTYETEEIVKIMLKDQKVRKRIARENHLLFFCTYFSHYIQYDFADFHREMFELSSDQTIPTLVITAARGIGKSTVWLDGAGMLTFHVSAYTVGRVCWPQCH